MSGAACPRCGEVMNLFGEGGGALVAQQLSEALETDIPLLAKIPFDVHVREGGDIGQPIVAAQPDSAVTQAFLDLADTLYAKPRGLLGVPLKLTPTT